MNKKSIFTNFEIAKWGIKSDMRTKLHGNKLGAHTKALEDDLSNKGINFLEAVATVDYSIFVKDGATGSVRNAAIEEIHKRGGKEAEEALERIASNGSTSDFCRDTAIGLLKNKKILNELTKENSLSNHIAKAATNRLKELGVPVQKAAPAAPKSPGRGM